MYNQTTKIINISQYKVSNTTLAYKDKNSNVFRNFEKVSECGYDDIFIIGQSIFFNDKEGNVLKINQNQEVFKEKSTLLNFSSDVIASNQLVYLDSSENLNLFDLNSKLDHNLNGINYNWENIFLSNNESTIFLIGNTSIHSYSLPSATPLWQFDLGSLGEYETYKGEVKSYSVEKFIGVWKDELLVACSNSLIISFDVNTGVEKRRWQTLENYYPNVKEVANKIPRTENFVLDNKTNTLIGLHIFSLVKIDLKTGIIEVVNMENELRKYHINLLKNNSSYAIDDSHIYTTATMGYEDNKSQWTYDCIIAIKREIYQVDWQYKFENEGLGTNTPQLADNKLYQLTSSNTLFIFEKE